MNNNSLSYFKLLKQHVVTVFLKNHSVSKAVTEWKGETITLFQEDLFEKTKAKVSEKWFYTYFKKTPEKLPRIDMLNLLCSYVGEDDWESFISKNKQEILVKNNKLRTYCLIFLFFIFLVLIYNYVVPKYHAFEFCFIDEDKKEIITHTELTIKILQKNESPIHLKTDVHGCFRYETTAENIHFIVSSPYYKTDTIRRNIKKHHNERVAMQLDYHALMMHYIAKGQKQNWKQQRNELDQLFDADAKIYQVFPNSMGVEFYSKQAFINKLTLPTKGLKNIKILKKGYHNGKIVSLKFMIE